MERLLYDIYIAESVMERDYQHFNTAEKKEAYIRKIFEAHKTTQAQWDTSLSWYSDRIDIYLKINDSVKVRLQHRQKEIEALMERHRAQMTIDPATLLPSYIPPYFAYSDPNVQGGFSFRWDSMQVAEKVTTDSFYFSYSVIGLPPGFSSDFSSMLELTYRDTTLYRFQKIEENGTYRLPATKYLERDSLACDTLSEINGFVRLRSRFGIPPGIVLHAIYLGEKAVVAPDSAAHQSKDESVEVMPTQEKSRQLPENRAMARKRGKPSPVKAIPDQKERTE